MNNKGKTENGKKKDIKVNEKPKLNGEKNLKVKSEKTSKKKKKVKKNAKVEAETKKEPETTVKKEPVCSREVQAIDRHLEQTEGILKEEKELYEKLDNYLNTGNIKAYNDDDFLKNNRALLAKSNAVLEKYENSLSNITRTIQNTLEQLENYKCKYHDKERFVRRK
jgi:hypothetical protein